MTLLLYIFPCYNIFLGLCNQDFFVVRAMPATFLFASLCSNLIALATWCWTYSCLSLHHRHIHVEGWFPAWAVASRGGVFEICVGDVGVKAKKQRNKKRQRNKENNRTN